MRLLFVRRGGLGDTLLMVPVLRALARAHDGAELHFAGVQDFAVLLRAHGVVARVGSSELPAAWLRTPSTARWGDYDLVVADDPALVAAARAVTAARAFEPRPRDRRPLPQQVAAQLGLALRWPEDAFLRPGAEPVTAGRVVLAPGSGGRAKCWPRGCWLALARAIAAGGRTVDVLVGPVEAERDDPRAWTWPVPVAFVVEPDLVTVAQHLGQASAFVGNDSGTTHLAAMLGVPTVALFGPSDPSVWAPVGPRVTVLGGGDATFAIDVREVAAALAAP